MSPGRNPGRKRRRFYRFLSVIERLSLPISHVCKAIKNREAEGEQTELAVIDSVRLESGLKKLLLKVYGHVPQCPTAGDANDNHAFPVATVGLECTAGVYQNIYESYVVRCVQATYKNLAIQRVFWRWLDMIASVVTAYVRYYFCAFPAAFLW